MADHAVFLWIAGALSWGAWVLVSHALLRNPRGDAVTGVVYHGLRVYACVVHRLRARGQERLRGLREPGPLIVVANHTAGVDPILIQASCAFEVRWMMAADMREARLEEFWKWSGVIFVDRGGSGANAGGHGAGNGERDGGARGGGGLREALRHLRGGGVIGIFPEGRIHRGPGELGEFRAGLEVLVARSGATVLPVAVRGTPRAGNAWGSLWKRSRSRVEFLEPIGAAEARANPGVVRARIAGALGSGDAAMRRGHRSECAREWVKANNRGP